MSAVAGVTPPFEDPSPQAVLRQYVAAANRGDTSSSSSVRSFGFADFIDVINPLHHLPGVSQLYRGAVNDQISEEASNTGKALYGFALGGPVGIGLMMAFDALTGQNEGERERGRAGDEPSLAEGVAVPGGAEKTPVSKPEQADTNTATNVLGETIAITAQEAAGGPFDLTQFGRTAGGSLVSEAAPQLREPDRRQALTALTPGTLEAQSKPKVPDEDDLGRLATHKANHLSLDVLKVLQERHAKLTASQQS